MNFFFECMKFLFSVIAAYVGIRAVVNSSKSAKLSAESVQIATESIRITKEKEQREQSSHLIPVSLSGEFPLLMPNQNEGNSPDVPHLIIDSLDNRGDILHKINGFFRNRINFPEDSNTEFTLSNVGKGSCVNLEYTFELVNLDDYKDFYFNSSVQNTSADEQGMRYMLDYEIKTAPIENKRSFYFIVKDKNMEIELKKAGFSSFEITHYAESTYFLEDKPFKKYVELLKPQQDIKLKIPAHFIFLCRHYLMSESKFMEKQIELLNLSGKVNSQSIKPIGKIILSYHDESLIRLGELSPNRKSVFEYSINLKKIESNGLNFKFPYYLEINLENSGSSL